MAAGQADLAHTSGAGEGTVPHPPSPQDGHHHGGRWSEDGLPRSSKSQEDSVEASGSGGSVHGDGREKGVLLLIY